VSERQEAGEGMEQGSKAMGYVLAHVKRKKRLVD